MKSKLKKNLLYQIIYQILQIIIPLAVTPYISRILGAEGLGIYSYTNSIAYYFYMVAMLGVANYGSRKIASIGESSFEKSKTFWEIYFFQGACGVLASIIYVIYIVLFNVNYKIIAFMQILYVLTSAVDISWFFFGDEEVKPIVIKNIIIKLISLVGIFIFVRDNNDLWIYTLLQTVSQLLGCLSMWLSVKGRITFVKPTFKGIKAHIIPNFKLFIPVIAVSIYKTMDKIMLGALSTKDQVGYYTNSEVLINVPMGFITAIGLVMLPKITNMLSKGEKNQSEVLFKKSMEFTMIFSCAAAFGIMAVSNTFVPIYYGEGFSECIILIKGQALVLLFLSWANIIRTQYLLPNNRDKQYIFSVLCGAIVNVVLNFIFIPKFKAAGALIGTISAEGMVCIIQSLDANRKMPIKEIFISIIPYIICGLIMSFSIYHIKQNMTQNFISLLVQVISGGVVYLVLVGGILILKNKKCNLIGGK